MRSEEERGEPELAPEAETMLGPLNEAQAVAFGEFEQWLEAELAKLVARWGHLATPNAGRSRGGMPLNL
jgi:hypothetical protein